MSLEVQYLSSIVLTNQISCDLRERIFGLSSCVCSITVSENSTESWFVKCKLKRAAVHVLPSEGLGYYLRIASTTKLRGKIGIKFKTPDPNNIRLMPSSTICIRQGFCVKFIHHFLIYPAHQNRNIIYTRRACCPATE